MLDPSLNVRVSGHDRHETLKRETDCQTEHLPHPLAGRGPVAGSGRWVWEGRCPSSTGIRSGCAFAASSSLTRAWRSEPGSEFKGVCELERQEKMTFLFLISTRSLASPSVMNAGKKRSCTRMNDFVLIEITFSYYILCYPMCF